jgi:hypothetical protein
VQDSQAEAAKNRVAFKVRLHLLAVDRPVDLDDQAGTVAVEINNQPADDLLAAKVHSLQAVRPQRLPKRRFRFRHRPAHLPRLLREGRVDRLAGEDVKPAQRPLPVAHHDGGWLSTAAPVTQIVATSPC